MWKTIHFESEYEVSNKGEVRNKKTKHVKSLRLSRNGYLRVTLYPSGKTYHVHRLVSEVFIEKPSDKDYVNHKDGNKMNNHVENLEWCTPKENFDHALREGLYKPRNMTGVNNHMSKFSQEDVDQIWVKHRQGLSVRNIADLLNFPYERVRRLIRGKTY